MKKRVLIEGMMPYRALNRLRREGISVENAKILQKNAVECSVDAKDIVKIFANINSPFLKFSMYIIPY